MAQHWPNRYESGATDVPDAVVLFRQVMSQQPDNSVVLVAIGPLRNLAHFLQSKPDGVRGLAAGYRTGAMEGRVDIDDKGRTRWHADPASHQGYLVAKMSNSQLGKIIAQLEADAGHGTNGKKRD
jgi:hypothetical protein